MSWSLLAEKRDGWRTRPALASKDLERVVVDTSVQPEAIAFPTDARLLHKALVRLGRLAEVHDMPLRIYYVRITEPRRRHSPVG